ncbi:MAG TPA: fdrA domain protein [Candidatus Caldiarchaeum subterraneum]|uniref:FdrA domain protein n=1 Tax=Caldiarchaeum subterraneum TaxID=311458 RepID=A0A833EBQ7_CALS0|nr:fdrA domain protein [Aigarchaeota archaeon]HIQ29075.1 fdrA domain protein [Candidatus Caldarchaeum subterraneum]
MEKILKLFNSELKIINIGLEIFYRDLKQQRIKVIHVNWQPSPVTEKDLEDALRRLT